MFVLVSLSEKKNKQTNCVGKHHGVRQNGTICDPAPEVLPSFCSHEQQFKELSHSFSLHEPLGGVTNIDVYKL